MMVKPKFCSNFPHSGFFWAYPQTTNCLSFPMLILFDRDKSERSEESLTHISNL